MNKKEELELQIRLEEAKAKVAKEERLAKQNYGNIGTTGTSGNMSIEEAMKYRNGPSAYDRGLTAGSDFISGAVGFGLGLATFGLLDDD